MAASVDETPFLAAKVSYIQLLADRIVEAGEARPMSMMFCDENDRTTICRLFEVEGQRLALLAVAPSGDGLTPRALDPALVMVAQKLARHD